MKVGYAEQEVTREELDEMMGYEYAGVAGGNVSGNVSNNSYGFIRPNHVAVQAIDAQIATRETLGSSYTHHMPLEAIAAASASFLYGARKYSDRNWELNGGLPWQNLIDSTKRHIEDFERGIDYDDGEKGSGLHQVCMIMASASMLAASVIRGIGTDNRIKGIDLETALTAKQCTDFIQEQLELAKEFKEKHGN